VRSVPTSSSFPLNAVLLATVLLVGACLFLVGCADEPNHERETGSITTGSISATSAHTRPGRTAIVQQGDTLFSIARRYNVTVYDLASSNNLSSSRLRVGQILSVPSY
jgi:outer membrane biogenesis lipoprotein LolB